MWDAEYKILIPPFESSLYAPKYLGTKDKNVTAPKKWIYCRNKLAIFDNSINCDADTGLTQAWLPDVSIKFAIIMANVAFHQWTEVMNMIQ